MEEKSGYTMTNSNPASGGGNMARSGYGTPSMRQGYDSMGHDNLIEKLGEEFRNMAPEEKMMMKNKVLTIMGSM